MLVTFALLFVSVSGCRIYDDRSNPNYLAMEKEYTQRDWFNHQLFESLLQFMKPNAEARMKFRQSISTKKSPESSIITENSLKKLIIKAKNRGRIPSEVKVAMSTIEGILDKLVANEKQVETDLLNEVLSPLLTHIAGRGPITDHFRVKKRNITSTVVHHMRANNPQFCEKGEVVYNRTRMLAYNSMYDYLNNEPTTELLTKFMEKQEHFRLQQKLQYKLLVDTLATLMAPTGTNIDTTTVSSLTYPTTITDADAESTTCDGA